LREHSKADPGSEQLIQEEEAEVVLSPGQLKARVNIYPQREGETRVKRVVLRVLTIYQYV
jgi:hypothetical protein